MTQYRKHYEDNLALLEKLEELHKKKYQILDECDITSPFVVELSGLPRTGKSVSVERVYQFFKKANFKIVRTEEPAAIIKNSLSRTEVLGMSELEFDDRTLCIARDELRTNLDGNPEIVLQDRGVIDNYFWYQMLYNQGKISYEVFMERIKMLNNDLGQLDQLFILDADAFEIMRRDYVNQIYLEERQKTNIDSIVRLKNGVIDFMPLINANFADRVFLLDTTSLLEIDTSIIIADKMMDGIIKKYSLRK